LFAVTFGFICGYLIVLDFMHFLIYLKLISYLCCIWLFCHVILIVNQI